MGKFLSLPWAGKIKLKLTVSTCLWSTWDCIIPEMLSRKIKNHENSTHLKPFLVSVLSALFALNGRNFGLLATLHGETDSFMIPPPFPPESNGWSKWCGMIRGGSAEKCLNMQLYTRHAAGACADSDPNRRVGDQTNLSQGADLWCSTVHLYISFTAVLYVTLYFWSRIFF